MPEASPAAPATPPSSGNAPGAPPAPASGGGSPSPQPSTPAPNSPPPAGAPWYGDLPSDLKTFAETKAFKDPSAALTAYKNLETFVGAPADSLIRKPDPNNAESVRAFRTAIGVPDAPEKYELPTPQGETGSDFVKWAAGTFLESGVPKDAAHAIVGKWNEFATAEMARIDRAVETNFANGMVKLRDEWGSATAEREQAAALAMRTFGKEAGIESFATGKLEDLSKIALGGVQLAKFLAAVGSRMSEASFHSGEAPKSSQFTADSARARISELMGDKQWAAAYLSGDRAKQAEMMQLQEISVGTAK